MKTKIALFDFDKTITTTDSIFLLWKYCIKKRPTYFLYFIAKMIPATIRWIFSKFQFFHIKNGLLSIFHKLGPKELEIFVTQELPKHFFKEPLPLLSQLKDDGFLLLLVSASPERYLIYVKNILPFDHVIGTKTNANFQLEGVNNRREEKVRRIHEYLKEKNITIDYENSCGYSDSFHADGPMLELVKHRYLINSSIEEEGFTNLKWHV